MSNDTEQLVDTRTLAERAEIPHTILEMLNSGKAKVETAREVFEAANDSGIPCQGDVNQCKQLEELVRNLNHRVFGLKE